MWISGVRVDSVVAVVSFVCGGERAVCRTFHSGVGVARVVMYVSCGCASVRNPVVGSCVGVVVVGRSSVGSRSCRL